MRESLKQELANSMGAELAAQEETAGMDEQFKNDEGRCEKAHLTIQKWLREHVE